MSEVQITIMEEDAELLLNLVNQVQVQGKEGMMQILRIIHRLEAVIPEKEEEVEDTD